MICLKGKNDFPNKQAKWKVILSKKAYKMESDTFQGGKSHFPPWKVISISNQVLMLVYFLRS